MKLLKILSAVCTSLIFIGGITPAQATSTDVVLNLEGNPTCSSLGDNSQILEFRDGNPDSTPGTPKQVILNIDGGGTQLLEYTVFTTNPPTMDWEITEVNGILVDDPMQVVAFNEQVNPINYIILKAQGGNNGARVFHFGAAMDGDGAIKDQDEEATGSNLAATSFCYGLTKGFDQPAPPLVLEELPACSEIGELGDLFDTGIMCADTGEEQLIINMALNKPQFGFDFTNENIRACTCNSELKPCNPDLDAQRVDSDGNYVNDLGQFVDQNGMVIPEPITADNLSQEDRTCLEFSDDNGIPTGVNENVPFVIQGVENPDSYICYTIGGTRYCYGHY